MRFALGSLALTLVGCESCDFAYGSIGVEIHFTPPEAAPTITICEREGLRTECSEAIPTAPRGPGGAEPSDEGVFHTEVSWDGLIGCRIPEFELRIEAEGCEPLVRSVPASRHRQRDPVPILRIDADLDCS